MAQTISDNLKTSLSRPTPVYKKTVELYRQVWGGSAYAYDTVLDITEYLTEDSAGVIMWKLDKEEFGVFTLDNVTLTFRNDRNQWKQDNPKGLFPSGKLINDSKIVIKIGAELADGTTSTVRSFTGYISGDPDYNPEEKIVSMTLVSAMSIFDKMPAEQISTLVEDELLGEDSGSVFTTANNGVAGVGYTVKRGTSLGAAVEINPTTDYTISDMNKKTGPLTVTLITALTAGEKLYISYRYWYQDKKLEWLAEQIMTLCGITSYSIIPAIFQSDVENSFSRSSSAEWAACTLQNIDTASTDGSFKQRWILLDDFADGDYTTNLLWTVISGSWSAAAGYLQGNGEIYAQPNTGPYGSWEFKVETASSFSVYFINKDATHYYGLIVTGLAITLFINNGGSFSTLVSASASVSLADRITVTRTTAGLFTIYINGVELTNVTDNTIEEASGKVQLYGNAKFADFWYSYDVVSTEHVDAIPILITDTVDTAGALTTWGKLYLTYTLYGGAVTIETYSSGSSDFLTDNDPAGWVAISATGDILSAKLRYLQVRVTMNKEIYAISAVPIVDALVLYYYTSATAISLVNLTGMTCRQALDLLAEMPAYEMGFKADDTFIYQSRTTSAESVMDLRSSTNIKSVRNLTDGIDRVYNRVVAEFGIYAKVASASSDTEPNSITKYGTREYQVGASNLLPADNVNLAYAVAPTILAYTKTPRRRCTIETQFILHLELGDKVTVYYDEPLAFRQWKWGDRDLVYGQADLEYYTEADLTGRLNLWGVVMRVEGVEFDFQNWTTSFDLVEVV